MKLPVSAAIAVTLALCAVVPSTLGGQQTTFRSSVDLIRVDVNILDRDGKPVTGLAADDFTVTVDGKPRRVVTAEYVATSREDAGKKPEPSKHYSTNVGTAGGRLIMFVVDHGTIPPGRARHALAAAQAFISRLNPGDRVGLVTIPGTQQVDFTNQHSIVRTMLQQIVGMAPQNTGLRQIGLTEALAISRGDQRAIDTAFQRECTGMTTEFERRMCRQELLTQASVVYAESRDRAHNTISALRSLLTRLAETPEPKTLVLVSGGLILDRDYSALSWFGPVAARGQITLYSLFVMPPHFEASLARLPINYRDDTNLVEEGLSQIAGLGRGYLFRLENDAGPIFARLESELSGYYLLGLEAEATDRDERPHRITVDVPARRGVEVRARREFSAAPDRPRPIETVLSETLRAPLLATDIRLKATAYTLRDRDSQKLRIVVGAEIDRLRDASGRLALAFALFDSQGAVVASHLEPDVSTRTHPRTGVHQYFGGALAERPGVYTLKVAVADDLRRRGSVEHTFDAQLKTAGTLRVGDLLLAEGAGPDSLDVAEPIISADYTGSALHAGLEVYSEREPLGAVNVTFEIAEEEGARAINSTPAAPQRAADSRPTSRAFMASLPLDILPPGHYVASAVVHAGGRAVTRVSRPFRVARASVISKTGSVTMPAFIPSRVDGFDRKAVLTADVVSFFIDRLSSRNARVSGEAMAHAREGKFDALMPALKASENDELAVAFLSGLALYARGDTGAAADRFRQALKIDSEFFPAAFYLGACYAAGGRHRDAANAWRTSLITESEAPFIYPLVADALIRARDAKGAVAVLTEAFERWPDNEQLRLRLGNAYVSAARPADAVKMLDPYLAKHPADVDTLFTLLRALYDARSAGAAVESPERDRERFMRYAAAYAAAGGPQQPLVERWKKYLEGR